MERQRDSRGMEPSRTTHEQLRKLGCPAVARLPGRFPPPKNWKYKLLTTLGPNFATTEARPPQEKLRQTAGLGQSRKLRVGRPSAAKNWKLRRASRPGPRPGRSGYLEKAVKSRQTRERAPSGFRGRRACAAWMGS